MVNSFANCEWLASAFQRCIFRLNRNGVCNGAERSRSRLCESRHSGTLRASTLAQNEKAENAVQRRFGVGVYHVPGTYRGGAANPGSEAGLPAGSSPPKAAEG